jgi:hypothetical protein
LIHNKYAEKDVILLAEGKWHRFFKEGQMNNHNRMLNLDDFLISTFEEKCDVVSTQSNYISLRILGDSKVYLYHTGKFFIEVYYSPTYKQVLMIHAFNDLMSLEPYLERVSLAGIGF